MKKALLFLLGLLFVNESFANDIAANVTNPVCDNATLEKYNGTANVEIDWVPNTIALRWYNGEQQLSVPTESQSCTYDGAMVIPSAPTRTGYTFMGWTVIDVPNGYTKLEYITYAFGQYIDTNVRFNSEIVTVEFDIDVLSEPGKYGQMGAQNAPNNTSSPLIYGNHLYIGNDVVADVYVLAMGRHSYELSANSGIYTIRRDNSTLGTGTFAGSMQTINGWPFGNYHTNFPMHYDYATLNGNLYSLKLYDNNILKFSGIPARRDSDGVLGMYDTVTGQFFTNAGTGTFIAGPVVLPSGYTRLEYLEGTGTQWLDTGIILTSDDVTYEWEAKEAYNESDTYNWLFGSIGSSDGHTYYSGNLHGNYSYRSSYIGLYEGRAFSMSYWSPVGEFHKWSWVINSDHSTYLIRDGTSLLPATTWNGTLNKLTTITLYGTHIQDGRVGQISNVAFKYFRIIDNGQTVFNGIPARRNNDGVLGMYDTVSQTFKTNGGTGTFVAGPVSQ